MPVRLTPPRISSPATEGSRPPPRRSLCAGVRTSKALFLLGARSRGDGQAWGSPLVAPVPAIRGFPTQVLGHHWNVWPAHGPPYTVILGTFQGNTQPFSPPDARHGSWVTSPRLLPCGDTDFKPEGNPGPFGQRSGRQMRRLRPQRRGGLLGNKQGQTRLLRHPLSLDLAPRAS